MDSQFFTDYMFGGWANAKRNEEQRKQAGALEQALPRLGITDPTDIDIIKKNQGLLPLIMQAAQTRNATRATQEALREDVSSVEPAAETSPASAPTMTAEAPQPSLAARALTGNAAQQPPGSFLNYINKNATRNQTLAPTVENWIAAGAEAAGVKVKVFSGGQPPKGSGLPRVGSTRHDNGNAADVYLAVEENGKERLLDMRQPEDQQRMAQFVAAARKAGATGIGAGVDYMGPHGLHIGGGKEAAWGAGGKGENAPGWLRQAFYGTKPEPGATAVASARPVSPAADLPASGAATARQQGTPSTGNRILSMLGARGSDQDAVSMAAANGDPNLENAANFFRADRAFQAGNQNAFRQAQGLGAMPGAPPMPQQAQQPPMTPQRPVTPTMAQGDDTVEQQPLPPLPNGPQLGGLPLPPSMAAAMQGPRPGAPAMPQMAQGQPQSPFGALGQNNLGIAPPSPQLPPQVAQTAAPQVDPGMRAPDASEAQFNIPKAAAELPKTGVPTIDNTTDKLANGKKLGPQTYLAYAQRAEAEMAKVQKALATFKAREKLDTKYMAPSQIIANERGVQENTMKLQSLQKVRDFYLDLAKSGLTAPPLQNELAAEQLKKAQRENTTPRTITLKSQTGEDYTVIVGEDGVMRPPVVQGQENQAPMLPKLTEAQGKTVDYYIRGTQGNQGLTPDAEKELLNWTNHTLQNTPVVGGSEVARNFQNEGYQKAYNSARNFLAMVLRKDTGAAITDKEFKEYTPIYIPAPGDKPETIALKRQNRETALQAMKDGLGIVGPQLDRVLESRKAEQAKAQSGVINDAKAAIAKGADPEKVRARLKGMGIDLGGL